MMLKNGSLISRILGVRALARRLNILDSRALELEIRADDLESRLEEVIEALAFTETVQGDDSETAELLAKVEAEMEGWNGATADDDLAERVASLRESRHEWFSFARRLETENAELQARVADLDRALTNALQNNSNVLAKMREQADDIDKLTERVGEFEATEKQRKDTAAQCWGLQAPKDGDITC